MSRIIAVILLTLLAGCGKVEPEADSGPSVVRIDQRMGRQPDPGFARALEPRQFEFPTDHGAHPEYATEWWYFTGNLRDAGGRRYGYQLTLFRVGLEPGTAPADSEWRTHQVYMGHLALSDIRNRRHYSSERFGRAAAGIAGAVATPLRIWLGPWSIASTREDLFPLRLQAASTDFGIDLTLQAGAKGPVLQGDNGLSRKGAEPGNASYYYSYTRLPSSGYLRIGDRHIEVGGDSWFDREWSSSALAVDQAGWDWFALQLEDGRELMFYRMRGRQGQAQRFSQGSLVKPDGNVLPLTLDQVELRPTRYWHSQQGVRYPVAWHLRVPGYALDLNIEAAFDNQEMPLTVRYWEGAVNVSGSHEGVGYLELSGYAP